MNSYRHACWLATILDCSACAPPMLHLYGEALLLIACKRAKHRLVCVFRPITSARVSRAALLSPLRSSKRLSEQPSDDPTRKVFESSWSITAHLPTAVVITAQSWQLSSSSTKLRASFLLHPLSNYQSWIPRVHKRNLDQSLKSNRNPYDERGMRYWNRHRAFHSIYSSSHFQCLSSCTRSQ
jgi:hypothetical protein